MWSLNGILGVSLGFIVVVLYDEEAAEIRARIAVEDAEETEGAEDPIGNGAKNC